MTLISKPSVQSLHLEMLFDGQSLSTGTGFVVTSAIGPCLITNRHNVTGRRQDNGEPLSRMGAIPNQVAIMHNSAMPANPHAPHGQSGFEGPVGTWRRVIEPLLAADLSPLWHEHPRFGSEADFVALPLTVTDGVTLYPYMWRPEDPAQRLAVRCAGTVSVIGFPLGLTAGGYFAAWASGFVASEPELDYDGKPVFLVDCRTRPGQSGSAVVTHRQGGEFCARDDGSAALMTQELTQLLGIYSGRIHEGSDLGMVWKAQEIQHLIRSLDRLSATPIVWENSWTLR
ncbi:Trypsin-like peptidase domain-containing protein [Pseudoxanthomonas sp. GM95]|nr:Trypsin-like peptidase domain-containing protein [Pseudoxanthomonas sp. GM95]